MNIPGLIGVLLFFACVLCFAFVKPVQSWLANFVMKGGVWFNLFVVLIIVGTFCLVGWIFYENWSVSW